MSVVELLPHKDANKPVTEDTWARIANCIHSGIRVLDDMAMGKEIVSAAKAQLEEAKSLLIKAGCNKEECYGHHEELFHIYYHLIRRCQNPDCVEGNCNYCSVGLTNNKQRDNLRKSLIPEPKEEEEAPAIIEA
jgi:hypothetical protein